MHPLAHLVRQPSDRQDVAAAYSATPSSNLSRSPSSTFAAIGRSRSSSVKNGLGSGINFIPRITLYDNPPHISKTWELLSCEDTYSLIPFVKNTSCLYCSSQDFFIAFLHKAFS